MLPRQLIEEPSPHLAAVVAENAEALSDALEQERSDFDAHGVRLDWPDSRYGMLPAVVPASARQILAKACSAVMEAIEMTATHLYRDASEMAHALCMDADCELKYTSHPPLRPAPVIARPDIIVGGGNPFVVEANIIPNSAPFPEVELATRAILGVPRVADAFSEHRLRPYLGVTEFVTFIRGLLSECREESVMISCPERDLAPGARLWSYLALVLNRSGIDAFVCPLEKLEDHIEDIGTALVYRFFDEPETVEEEALFSRVFEAMYREHAPIHVLGRLEHRILHSKTLLAHVSEGKLAAPVVERAHGLIPWTRLLEDKKAIRGDRTVELLPFAERNRDRLVLKPSEGFGGRGVVLGAETSDSKWRDAIAEALAVHEHWIVQERVHGPTVKAGVLDGRRLNVVTCEPTYGLFMVDGTLCGVLRRDAPPHLPSARHLSRGALITGGFTS